MGSERFERRINARNREPHYIEIAPLHTAHKARGAALNAVSTGFVIRLVGVDVRLDLRAADRPEGNLGSDGKTLAQAGLLDTHPGVHQMLDTLRCAGKKVCLLSNAQRLFTWPEMTMLELCGRFDRIFLSSDWGVKKPSPNYFNLVLQECGCPPDQVMMVGNSIHDDVEPARALGMRTCFLNTDGLNEAPECDLVCEGADYEKLLQMILPGAASDGAR